MDGRTRKAASVALVAAALIGVRTASAAGADLGGQQILVGNDAGEACSSAVMEVEYDVAYDATLQGFGVSAARLSGLDAACQGRDLVVTLSGPGGAALAELTAVAQGSQMTLAVPATTPVAAEQLTGVSVVLSGSEV